MRIGTRSILFGAHCFFIHPIFVFIGWWKLFGFPFDLRLWVAFFVHDLGYWGKPNMDGNEGERHPELGAKIMHKLFDWKLINTFEMTDEKGKAKRIKAYYDNWGNFSLYHSRYYAKRDDATFSSLCVADKYAIALEPTWFYLLRVNLSGEIKEFTAVTISRHESINMNNYTEEELIKLSNKGQKQWFNGLKQHFRRWVSEAMAEKNFTAKP